MPIDVYLRIPEDPKYSATEIEVEDEIFNFVQYIEMILTTDKGEVFGEPDMGASLEAYLWNTNITSATIKSEVLRQIYQYCGESASKIQFDIEVNFIKGEITDSILIDIIIDGTKVLGVAATPRN